MACIINNLGSVPIGILAEIETLARKSLQDKWGPGEIVSVHRDLTFVERELDPKTGEYLYHTRDLEKSCAFCKDARKRYRELIGDACESISCTFCKNAEAERLLRKLEYCHPAFCKVPSILCAENGKKGLFGYIRDMIKGPVFSETIVISLLELLKKSLKELAQCGEITEDTLFFLERILNPTYLRGRIKKVTIPSSL